MSSSKTYNLPILSNEGGLAAYLSQIKKFWWTKVGLGVLWLKLYKNPTL